MDKKTIYIIAAVVLVIIAGIIIVMMQTPSPAPNPNPYVPSVKPAAGTVKSEIEVAQDLQGNRITFEDNGHIYSLTPGARLILMLGNDYDWVIASSDEKILGATADTLPDTRVQAIYKVMQAGKATLSANGTCRQGKTCANPKAAFKISVEGVNSGNRPGADIIKDVKVE